MIEWVIYGISPDSPIAFDHWLFAFQNDFLWTVITLLEDVSSSGFLTLLFSCHLLHENYYHNALPSQQTEVCWQWKHDEWPKCSFEEMRRRWKMILFLIIYYLDQGWQHFFFSGGPRWLTKCEQMATNWELNRNTKNIELNYDKLHEFDSHWTDPEGLGTCFKKNLLQLCL